MPRKKHLICFESNIQQNSKTECVSYLFLFILPNMNRQNTGFGQKPFFLN